MDAWLQALAGTLAGVWVAYGYFLVLGCFFGVHATALLWTLRAATSRAWCAPYARGAVVAVEVLYGLLGPLAYLLAIARLPWLPWRTPAWLQAIAWTLLALVWLARLVGAPEQVSGGAGRRRALHVLLSASLLCLGALLVKDAVAAARLVPELLARPVDPATALLRAVLWTAFAAGWLSLYLVPATLLWAHLRTNLLRPDAASERFLLGGRPAVRDAVAASALLALAAWLVGSQGASTASVRRWLREHRGDIVSAARSQAVEPRLLASLLFVVQRDAVSPLSTALERFVVGSWLTEPHDAFLPPVPFDAAIGPARVHPSLALLAARDASLTRRDVALALLRERQAFTVAASVLATLAAQHRAMEPHEARPRPEVLATLYESGSVAMSSRRAPRPNAFGRAVRDAYDGRWMQRRFPPRGAARGPLSGRSGGPGARRDARPEGPHART